MYYPRGDHDSIYRSNHIHGFIFFLQYNFDWFGQLQEFAVIIIWSPVVIQRDRVISMTPNFKIFQYVLMIKISDSSYFPTLFLRY